MKEATSSQSDPAGRFLKASVHYLREEYFQKIVRCLEVLSEEQLWWRPNEKANSVGNLVLHLAGNLRQYVVSGVGGAEDIRRRDAEFAPRAGARGEIGRVLAGAIEDAVEVLDSLDVAALGDVRTIQGREMTVFDAVFHAVEHFSGHTGQIIYITKELTGRDLQFYGFEHGSVQHRF